MVSTHGLFFCVRFTVRRPVEPLVQSMVADARNYPNAVRVGLRALDDNLAAIMVISPATRRAIIARFKEAFGGRADNKGLN